MLVDQSTGVCIIMGGDCCKFLMQGDENKAAERARMDRLHAGAKFMRNDVYLGLTAKELWVRLSNDTSALAWRTTGTGSWTAAEFGEFDLTRNVSAVRSSGMQGIQILDKAGTVQFDIQAEDTIVRDHWVIGLSELLQKWQLNPETKPQVPDASGRTARESELDDHFKNRETEFLKNREAKLAAREQAAASRKAKYQSASGKSYSPLHS